MEKKKQIEESKKRGIRERKEKKLTLRLLWRRLILDIYVWIYENDVQEVAP